MTRHTGQEWEKMLKHGIKRMKEGQEEKVEEVGE